jgi:hypothetical protein
MRRTLFASQRFKYTIVAPPELFSSEASHPVATLQAVAEYFGHTHDQVLQNIKAEQAKLKRAGESKSPGLCFIFVVGGPECWVTPTGYWLLLDSLEDPRRTDEYVKVLKQMDRRVPGGVPAITERAMQLMAEASGQSAGLQRLQ